MEFEPERRRREDRDRQREKLPTLREQLKAFKRISELASEEEIRQQEFMPLQDDLPVPPVPPVPLQTPDQRAKFINDMLFAATYMDQPHKTGAFHPHPGLNHS
ncbi:molecular chaperone DnaJ [Colletotrichum tabaci]|uniref:Molecular chaperone DnaJ n=1 Tax=Colletotrichum tabaci TaxID=1209068 RepID=A0AAV9T3B3_9PEZI